MNKSNTGRFVWYELLTTDPKAAIAFYADVVGWKTQPFGEGGDLHDVGRQPGPARRRDDAPRAGREDGRAAALDGATWRWPTSTRPWRR